MSKIVKYNDCPNMPWEEKPKNCFRPIWRYSKNPITKRPYSENIDRVFNSSSVEFNGEFVGIFRADNFQNKGNIYLGHSKDGIHIELEKEPIKFYDESGNLVPSATRFDPRVVAIEDVYYIVFAEYTRSVTNVIAKTKDFKTFTKLPDPFTPNYRNGILFPRKINGMYKMLLRPCDAGDSKFGDIYLVESPDLHYFGNAKFVLGSGFSGWNWLKIGPGCTPIETDEGWLVFIHGVTQNCSVWNYSLGAVVLDKDDPSKVKYLCKDVLLMPAKEYELCGFTPNVVFPTSTLVDSKTGRIAIYYGGADSYTALAFTEINVLMDYIKKHS